MTAEEDELRALFGVLADRQAAAGTDGAWLRERWRRRQARRAGATGVLAALVLVGGGLVLLDPGDGPEAGLVADRPSALPSLPPLPSLAAPSPSDEPSPTPSAAVSPYPEPRLLDVRTGVRLLASVGRSLQEVDVDTGEVTVLQLDPRFGEYERLNVTRVGRQVVVVGDSSTGAGGGGGTVLATTDGPGSPWRAIGSSDPIVRESARAGHVWLSSIDEVAAGPVTTLTEVDLTGRVRQRVVLQETFGADPYDGGFLRASPGEGDEVELVDRRGRVLRSWPGLRVHSVRPDLALLAEVMTCTDSCRLVVLRPGRADRELQVPRTVAGDQTGGVTPDGSVLFTGAETGPDLPALAITRTDLRTGASRPVTGALAARYYGLSPTFSDDGRWMFFADADTRTIDAYDLRSDRMYRVGEPFRELVRAVVIH